MAKTQYIETVQIKTEGLQTRAQISMDAVREYATEERERGAVFPFHRREFGAPLLQRTVRTRQRGLGQSLRDARVVC